MKNVMAAVLLLAFGSAMAQQTLKVGTSEGMQAFYPAITAVYKEIGLVPEFVIVPSERSLKMVESGELDADMGRVVGATKGYQNMEECKESVIETRLLAVVRKDFKGSELAPADFKTQRYGLTRGTKLAEAFVKNLGLEATVANTPQQMLLMLDAGRFDVGLLIAVAPLSAYPEFATKLVQLSTPLTSAKSVHVLNTKWAAYAPKFDAALKAMKADGRMAKLLSATAK